MRNSLFLHCGWFLIAVIAFVIGSVNSSRDQSSTSGKDDAQKSRQDNRSSSSLSALGQNRESKTGQQEIPAGLVNPGTLLGTTAGRPTTARQPLSEWDIEELGQIMAKESNPLRRRMAFTRLLQGMTAENALLIRDQVKSLRPESSEFKDFHYAWGAIAGAEAVLNGKKTREVDMDVTMAGWASAEPELAFNWVNDLPEGDRARLKGAMIAGIADNDPAAAAGYAYQLASMGDKDADRMLGIVTSRVLGNGGHLEASVWAENLPDGAMRAAALDRVAHDYVAHDPEGAAAWAERFAGQAHNARVIEEVGDEWAERDPVAAIDWLNSLDAGKGKSEGLSSAFGEWAKRDPTAASQHLVSMPESPDRDSAISGFSRRLASENPQAAIAWASEINDASSRENALVRAGQSMFRRDASGTREWLASSGLPPAAQEQIVNPPQNRR
jgi:hypothetical protein